MRGPRRLLVTVATMLVAAANCAHSCGQPKSDFTYHEPCTNFAPGVACAGAMGTICEVKNHPDPACNEWRVCARSGSTWQTRPPENANCPTTCPPTFAEASDEDAGPAPSPSSSSSLCEYPEGTCGPALLDGGAPGPWRCAKTTALRGTADQCPPIRPAIGTPGCPDGLVCEYGYCKLKNATRLQCQENQWVLMDAFFLAGDAIDPGRCGE